MDVLGLGDPRRFADQVWRNVLCQFIAVNSRGEPSLLVGLYRPDPTARVAWIDVVSLHDAHDVEVEEAGPVHAMMQLASTRFGMCRLFAEYLSLRASPLASVSQFCHQQGRLASHTYWDGFHWDLVFETVCLDELRTPRRGPSWM